MNFQINFSKDSLKFLENNNMEENFILDKIKFTIQKLKGENININIKKLKGEWKGFYRIKSGKLRIIAEFQFEYYQVYIERIDWRGNAYKD